VDNIGSHDVKIWSIDKYVGKRGTTYRARWLVEGKRFAETFTSRKHADTFRSELLVALRQGLGFDRLSGRPIDPSKPTAQQKSWLELASEYVDLKWTPASARHRKGMAEALVNITFALIDIERSPLSDFDRRKLVAALTYGAFCRGLQREHDPNALEALQAASPPAAALGDPIVIRKLLNAIAVKQDGSPAAEATIIRKRATLHNVLQFAVESRVITVNPMKTMKKTSGTASKRVDPRVVISRKQGRSLLKTVRKQAPHLAAYFALLMYAGLRPAEARNVRRQDLHLPEEGWGSVLLHTTAQLAGSAWTDGSQATEQRPLKHRGTDDTRSVPLNPAAVKILRRHLDCWECGPRGHLFVARTGKAGKPLSAPYTSLVSLETLGRTWSRARQAAFTAEQAAGPLARRPYDLRHARLTWWLNAGVPPTQVARWAGHGVRVLLDVYAGCVDGGEQRAIELLKNDA
jgi:integrase